MPIVVSRSFIKSPNTQKIALEREEANQGKALTSPKAYKGTPSGELHSFIR